MSSERNFLSDRERDVLTGIGKGFSYVEVADALKITTNTVRTHVRHIYEKLSVNSRAEALYEYNRRMAEQGRPPIR
jgi:DNA-binding NarL/FixJ family response regulator